MDNRHLSLGVGKLLPLLQHIHGRAGPNAKAEFGQIEQGLAHLNLFSQHIQKGVLLLTGEPDTNHRTREQQGCGLHILTRSDRFKPGGSPPSRNPLPDINFICQTRGHKITVRVRRAPEAVTVQVYRFPIDGMETRGSRAEISLGHLFSPRNPGECLGLREPGPGLPQLKVSSEDALQRRVQPGVAKLTPPLTQDTLACRPMMIRLRDGNRRLLQGTHGIRATACDYE